MRQRHHQVFERGQGWGVIFLNLTSYGLGEPMSRSQGVQPARSAGGAARKRLWRLICGELDGRLPLMMRATPPLFPMLRVLQYGILLMPEREGADLPEPHDIIQDIVQELGLDATKKPPLFEGPPEEQLFPEEAPSFEGRYIAGACLEQIYNLVLRYTPPGAPILLTRGDVRWFHQEFRQAIQQVWRDTIPSEPLPEFTLAHLLGATKRQVAHYFELKHFHESDAFDPALGTYSAIADVVALAISEDNPDS